MSAKILLLFKINSCQKCRHIWPSTSIFVSCGSELTLPSPRGETGLIHWPMNLSEAFRGDEKNWCEWRLLLPTPYTRRTHSLLILHSSCSRFFLTFHTCLRCLLHLTVFLPNPLHHLINNGPSLTAMLDQNIATIYFSVSWLDDVIIYTTRSFIWRTYMSLINAVCC